MARVEGRRAAVRRVRRVVVCMIVFGWEVCALSD